jgi:hypothetical protein
MPDVAGLLACVTNFFCGPIFEVGAQRSLRDQTVLSSSMEPLVACSPNCSAPQGVIIFIAS